MTIRTRQIPIRHYIGDQGRGVELRYRCIEARHEGRTYNSNADATWCLCGRVIRPGDTAVRMSVYERAEFNALRPYSVGIAARAYLNEVHRRAVPAPEPVAVPTEAGDQYVIEMEVP